MIKFGIMGKIILPLLKFALFFLISAFVFILSILIFNWGQWFSIFPEIENSIFLFLPAALNEVIIPSITASLLFTFFSYRKTNVNPAAVILIAAAVFAVIYFGFGFSSSMSENSPAVSFQPFNERGLSAVDSGIIYIDSIRPEDIEHSSGVLVRETVAAPPAFRYYEDGILNTDSEPGLELSTGESIALEPLNPVFHESFKPGILLESYFADIGFFNSRLQDAAAAGGNSFLIMCAAAAAFLLACLLFRGASVWPLFDFIFILALHRGVFYLYALVSREAAFISETVFNGSAPVELPLAVLAGSAFLIFLIGLLNKLTRRRQAA